MALVVDREFILEISEQVVSDRRYLHQHPERGFDLPVTAKFVADRLKLLDLEVQTGIGQSGVVGILPGGRAGKTLLIRADMDALPIHEENEVAYRSLTDGVMHACGHDAHTAILLGTARVLAGMRDEIPGTIKFVFQPAEEIGSGARAMIEDGVLDNPPVDASLGLHIWQEQPLGVVSVHPGPMMAAFDGFNATIRGVGGHAAMPELCVDATVIAAEIVVALQTLVSREVSGIFPAVVSVGTLHSGTASNIISGEATMSGSVRTLHSVVGDHLATRIPELIKGIATSMRGEAEVSYFRGVPPLANAPEMSKIVQDVAQDVVGGEHIVTDEVNMASEDMGLFLDAAPGCFFFLGSNNERTGKMYGHHHPRFDVDEDAFPIGIEILARSALTWLERHAD